ncbi:MAG TPA: dUTP diphosphatase [Methylovirgula sp.]|jgi:dUTP pyrophosphatase
MSETISVPLRRLAHSEGLPLPSYQSAGAAGLDLVAAVAADAKLTIEPGGRALVPTGIALQIPKGFEAQIRPRSGLALERGVTILNAPGTIDSDYRGEICVLLVNFGSEAFELRRGLRIAQLVVAPVTRATLTVVDELEESARGTGGFGSTGTHSLLERDG